MRRIQYGVALVGLLLAGASAGCQVDFLSGNRFACEGEGVQGTCLSGYRCNFGTCVPAGEYVQPDTWVRDTWEAPDIPPDAPEPDIPPPDVPDIQPPPPPPWECDIDSDCAQHLTGRSGLVCSVEKVCCDTRCDSECRTCLDPDSPAVCTYEDEGTACAGEGGDSDCNACNATGQCLPDVPKACGTCQECAVVTGAASATCELVAAGTDPHQNCGDSEACGGVCSAVGDCDLDAAAPANGTRCDTCRECNFGWCVPVLPETPDEGCGDASCGGVCASGGLCSTDFLAATTKCGTCH